MGDASTVEQTFTADLRICPRCGAEHLGISIARYEAPPTAQSASFWAICPTAELSVLLTRERLSAVRVSVDG